MERKTQIIRDANDSGRGPGPDVMASSTLEGTDVYNQAEQKLGTIQDIMIDIERGRVAYAVLSHGGVLGIGEKLFAIPWSALTLDTQRECFMLDIDLQRFKDAEGFDKDNWPRMGDLAWATRVHEYYNQPPYW
ncbi:MAG TPA: PRC-barrel domain-containing protein [Paralcaligenes sp.]|jgi:sporulation protein YlmC with PRC-barrel domain